MMRIYAVYVKNPDPFLDLRQKSDYLMDTINYLRNHSYESQTSFLDLIGIGVLVIKKHYVVLIVEETNTAWHEHLGYRLAKKTETCRFRSADNPKEMFDWILIRSQEEISRLVSPKAI